MAKAAAQRAPRAFNADSRTRMIGAVHAACKQKGIDQDARREIQEAVIGKASLTTMDAAELRKLLDHLNRGNKPSAGRGAHAGKIRALYWSLFWLGEVDDPNDRAIDGFVRRQTGISALRFLDHKSAPSVIEALKSRLGRLGVEWSKDKLEAFADRRAVAEAIFAKLPASVGRKSHAMSGHVALSISMTSVSSTWTAQDWDAAIRFLGKQLRKGLGK